MKKNMKTVKMLVDTAYQGPRKVGDVVTVPEDFANRWAKNGIAAFVSDEPVQEPDEVIGQEQEDNSEGTGEVQSANEDAEDAVIDYASMKAKELYDLCVEKGIEVEAKKSKEYYIEKLNEAE